MGIIVFNNDDKNNIKYLMVRRKDSLGYIDFMRGKYPLYNKRYLLNIINEMTIEEKENLLTKTFDELWLKLWGDFIGLQYRSEEKISREKFIQLNIGINLKDDKYNLETLINSSNTSWLEPEWGFAKGRRNFQEKDLNCALREFEEETGCDKNSLKIIQNILPFEEIFTGSNYKSYKHKYFISYKSNDNKPICNFQKSEISKVEWYTYENAKKIIRPYNLERIDIINNINNIIANYNFY